MGLYTNLATAKVSLRRVLEMLDAPVEVRERPDAPARCRHVRGDVEFDGVTLSFDRGGRCSTAVVHASCRRVAGDRRRRAAAASRRSPTCCCACSTPTPASSGSMATTCATLRLDRHPPPHRGRGAGTVLLHASIAENIRYARPDATDEEVARGGAAAALEPFIRGCPAASPPSSASAARRCRRANGSGWRLRARSWRIRRCWCSTSRRRRSIRCRERQVIAGYEAVMRGRTTIVITHQARAGEPRRQRSGARSGAGGRARRPRGSSNPGRPLRRRCSRWRCCRRPVNAARRPSPAAGGFASPSSTAA